MSVNKCITQQFSAIQKTDVDTNSVSVQYNVYYVITHALGITVCNHIRISHSAWWVILVNKLLNLAGLYVICHVFRSLLGNRKSDTMFMNSWLYQSDSSVLYVSVCPSGIRISPLADSLLGRITMKNKSTLSRGTASMITKHNFTYLIKEYFY